MNLRIVTLLCAVAGLLLIGLVALNSALVTETAPGRLHAQALALAVGGGLALAAALCDYRRLRRRPLPWVLLGLSLVALVLVLIPGIGVRINGARRWYWFGGQPSEFAKVAVLVWIAAYAASHLARMKEFQIGFVTPLAWLGAATVLIFVEQDWGTALLLLGVGVTVLAVAGTHWSYLVSAGVASTGLLALLLRLDPMRWARLVTCFDPERHQYGVGAQQWHGLLALGSGGLGGTFFGGGRHKFGFVPEQQTDFIFSLIGEELGLWGTLLVLGLYAVVFASGLSIAWRAGEPFGRFLAVGLTSLITYQALVNLGVVTCLLPNKGIPLPFISYGCSDLVCMCVAVGLLVSIARQSPEPPPGEPPLPPEDEAVRARRAAVQALPLGTKEQRWCERIRSRLSRFHAANAFAAPRDYQRPPRAIADQSATESVTSAPEVLAARAELRACEVHDRR